MFPFNKIRVETDFASNSFSQNYEYPSEDKPKKLSCIPECYWELMEKCWSYNPNDRPSFEEITNWLKDGKYAIEEFRQKTDLDQLHKYQEKIEKEE